MASDAPTEVEAVTGSIKVTVIPGGYVNVAFMKDGEEVASANFPPEDALLVGAAVNHQAVSLMGPMAAMKQLLEISGIEEAFPRIDPDKGLFDGP